MCKLCEIKPVYEFTNKRKLCKRCFVRWFDKKFLYVNRKFGMIKKGDIIFIKGRNDFRSVVLEDVLKMFAEKLMIKVVKLRSQARDINKQLINDKKITKIAIPLTIDVEAGKIIKEIIKGKVKDLDRVKPVENRIIKPLYLFLDEEVLLYAKLRSLKFKKRMEKKNKINSFIDESEKKHPEVKRAILNSYLKIYN